MNEQEMIQRQKIEKREKTDIILAYILIVILLAGIGIVLYLKYGSSQDTVPLFAYILKLKNIVVNGNMCRDFSISSSSMFSFDR